MLVFPSDAFYLYLCSWRRLWAAAVAGDLRQSSRAQASGLRCAISNYEDAGALAGRRAVTETESLAARSDAIRHAPGGRRAALLVVSCYLGAALIVTWRLWPDPASRTVAGNPTDADLFAWYLRYAAAAIQHGHLPAIVTTAMNAPVGINMMWNTSLLLPTVLLAPVTLLLGPQVSLTVLTTAGFAGSAAALYYVLRRWQVSTAAAALAGAVYGFSPALVHSALAHYNLEFAVLPPLIIDAGLCLAVGRPQVASAPRVRAVVGDGARLGLLAAAQLFISEEVALITAIAGLVLVAGVAAARPRSAVRRLGPAAAGLLIAAAVSIALAGPALWTQFGGPLVQHGPLFPLDYYVNDPASFVTPSSYLLFHTAGTAAAAARYQGGETEYLAYLGWPLIIIVLLAAVACWRRPAGRAATLTLGVLVVLSFGGHPLVGGTLNPAVNLPWHWLEEHQLFAWVLPDRFSIVADGVAAALIALGIHAMSELLAAPRPRSARLRLSAPVEDEGGDRPLSGRARAAVLGMAALACLPPLPRPLASATAVSLPAGWTRTFTALHLPSGAPVLVVPVPTNILTPAMRWQADTGQPSSIVGGYFIGPGAGRQAYIRRTCVKPGGWIFDRLWAAGLRPASAFAVAAAAAGLPTADQAGPAPVGDGPTPAPGRADLAAGPPAARGAGPPAGSPP